MKKKKNRKTAPPINIKPDEPMAAESLNSIKNLIDAGDELSGSNIQDKCRETINLLLKKVETNPDDYPAYFYLSQLYMNVKDEGSGIEYAKKCLALLQRIKNNSDKSNNDLSFYYSIYHILALALISQKNYNEARDIIKEGLEKLTDDIDLLYDFACAGYFLNDPSLIIKGGESYLKLIRQNENIDNIELNNKDNNRIISTTSQSAIFSVKCWLIISYIQINNTDGFAKLWEEVKLQLKEQTADEQPSDYKNIALTFLVSMAESLLTQNQSRKFLEISSFILTTYLEHQLESIKGASELASAYNMLAQQQDKTEQGITIALSSLNIAWILTDDSQYLDAIKKLKMNDFSQLKEIEQSYADNKLKSNQTSAVIESNKSQNITPAFFRTAFAEVDITPKISDANPVYLQGMAGKERKAIGVASPLKMQMLLIEDKNQTKILFVAADIFGFGSEMVELVRKTAAGWGIHPERIILNASHTQYAPGTLSHTFRTMGPFFKEYAMEIAGIICNSLTTLYDNLEESYIYSGKTDINVGVSSRLGENGTIEFQTDETSSYDQHTPFLLFEQQKSNKKIIMVNHGCQPTGLGDENNISADFPGYFRDELIKTGKVDHVMYLQGASGDIRESSTFDGEKVLCSRLEDAQKNGRVMAQSIQSVLDSDYSLMIPLIESKISSISKTIYLRLKKIPDINQINLLKNDPLSEPVVREWASRLSLTYPNGDFPNALALDIQVVSIGNSSTFICFPAVPVSSIGINLKKLTDSPDTTFILGNTNGLICYIPDDRRIEYGGYEADISPYYYMIPYLLAKGAEANIISEITNCYLKVCSSVNPKNENLDKGIIIQSAETNQSEVNNTNKSKLPSKSIIHKNLPTVSIGMPVYNMKDTVKEAIDTVLNQTFSDFELIISDNASDDGTEEICREAAKQDSRITYHRNMENILGENFRLPFLLSKGKYFMWAASDDARKPTMLERCLEALEADKEAILAYTYTEVLDPATSTRSLYYDHYRLDQDDPADRYINLVNNLDLGNMIYGLYRRDMMYSINMAEFNPSTFMVLTDAMFLSKIVLRGKVVQIPEMLFIRRRGKSKPWVDNVARIESLASRTYFKKGVTLPVSESIIEHVRIILESDLPANKKHDLIQITYDAYIQRFGNALDFEIDRAVKLAKEGNFTETWNGSPEKSSDKSVQNRIDQIYAGLLFERFERAGRILPNHKGIYIGKALCLRKMGREHEADLQIQLANRLKK